MENKEIRSTNIVTNMLTRSKGNYSNQLHLHTVCCYVLLQIEVDYSIKNTEKRSRFFMVPF